MNLPSEFEERMKGLLGEEYPIFRACFNLKPVSGIRVNLLKCDMDRFLEHFPYKLEPIPWIREGFYFTGDERPAKHPYYHAGLFYIQEPSAMLPGVVADPKPGERILDLCAAPGGKSTQMAARLSGDGLLVSNDISFGRIRALVRNIELFGATNCIVVNEQPHRLADRLPEYFDKVLVDAPCSGEGMFRKDPGAVGSWRLHNCASCALTQENILKYAAALVRTGGYLIYSTCTFSPEENEGSVERFLREHPEFEIEEIPKENGFGPGRPDWIDGGREELSGTVRVWPHHVRGEGHFVAKLRKLGEDKGSPAELKMREVGARIADSSIGRKIARSEGMLLRYEELPPEFRSFASESLCMDLTGRYYLMRGAHIFMVSERIADLSGLKIVKPGLYLGELRTNRFVPAHGLALALKAGDAVNTLDLPGDGNEVAGYLKGETLRVESPRGWLLVTVDGFSLGWAKQSGGVLKNHYPAGWRLIE